MSKLHFQIAVLGSGFAGSLMAMIAQRLGFSTVLIERGRHPRFVIGESSTPLANLLLEEISVEYDLSFVRPLCKWGTWQKEFPQIGCGLKRGFTFYHHEFGKPFEPDPARERQLLVGASPNEEIADTHWYRPDFDHYLVQQAEALGVTYWDEAQLESVTEEASVVRFAGKRRGEILEFTAEFAVDATGPRGFLHRALGLLEKTPANFPATQGLFSHFENVGALPEKFCLRGQTPPYPPEHAAVHHVFPGGWIWVLRFNNGLTSVGVAATDAVANEFNFKEGEPAWQRLLQRLPSVAEILRPARATIPFVHSPRLSFQSGAVTGVRWALLPSAAGFVDPLLSTGFPLTLLGVKRIGQIFSSHWQRISFKSELDNYARLTTLELDAALTVVEALYATMNRFHLFRQLSLLYFTAASFSETARRLGSYSLADSFLLCRHPVFAKQFAQICQAAKRALPAEESTALGQRIRAAIEPFDVMGLTDDSRNNWYPAFTNDLFRNRAKLGATEQEITTMLQKCGIQADADVKYQKNGVYN